MKFLNKQILRLGFLGVLWFSIINVSYFIFNYKIIEDSIIVSNDSIISIVLIFSSFVFEVITIYFILFCLYHIWAKSIYNLFFKILWTISFGLNIPILIYYVIEIEMKNYHNKYKE